MLKNYTFRPVCDLCEICDIKPWFCENCNLNLCRKCKEKHLQLNEDEGAYHRLLPIAREMDISLHGNGISQEDDTECPATTCAEHNNEKLSKFCISCKIVSCKHCWEKYHIGHDEGDIKDEAKKVRQTLSQSVLPSMKGELDSTVKAIEDVREMKLKYVTHTRSMRSEVSDKIVYIKLMADAAGTDAIAEINATEETDMAVFSYGESDLMDRKRVLEKGIISCESQLRTGNSISQIQYACAVENILKTLSGRQSMENPEFPVLEESERLCKESIAKMIGRVRKGKKQPEICHEVQEECDDQVPQINVDKVIVLHVPGNEAAYCIKTVGDGSAWVGTGSQSVIRIKQDGTVIEEHPLDFYPYNITAMENGSVLLSKGNTIKRISPTGEMSNFYDADSFFVQGLCYSQHGHIYVCLTQRNFGKVIKLSVNAEVVFEIKNDKKNEKIFKNPTKIAENPITGGICVEDSGQNSVVVVDSLGQPRFNYRGVADDTFSPFYVACDSRGNILIGDNSHFRVHLLDPLGNFQRYILTQEDGLFSPWGMDVDNDWLWIGTLSGKIWLVRYSVMD